MLKDAYLHKFRVRATSAGKSVKYIKFGTLKQDPVDKYANLPTTAVFMNEATEKQCALSQFDDRAGLKPVRA